MKTQLYTAMCVLISAGLATAQIYHIPTVSLDTPDNSVCPPDAQLEAVRNNISANLSDILVEIAANKTTIPETTECGGSGWRRVAFLNMTDPDQTCPSSWRLFSQDSVRACGRQYSNIGSCDSVQFSPDGYEYTQVCGRILGYQYMSPDGYNPTYHSTPGNEINEPYVDGVSVTYGAPRQHIWTLYGGLQPDSAYGCCGSTPPSTALSFIENNYFCDTGNPDSNHWQSIIFNPDSPLWDGIAGCGDASCCAPHSGPWFNTTLTAPTTDDIDIRICGDETTNNEDTPLELVEIYVK